MSEKILEIISLAILTESIITYFKEFFVNGDFSFTMFFSVILGIAVAIAYKVDLLSCINLESTIPYVGNILTGILVSRGSNYLYDFISTFTSTK